MPRGNGTGPAGMGPMSGRAAGYCAGFSTPGYANPVAGRGVGFGWAGRGRGFRNQFYATGMPGWQRAATGYQAWGQPPVSQPVYPAQPSKEQELDMLKAQAEQFQNGLDQVHSRISELEKESSKQK